MLTKVASQERLVTRFIPLQSHLIPLVSPYRSEPRGPTRPNHSTRIPNAQEAARRDSSGMGPAVCSDSVMVRLS